MLALPALAGEPPPFAHAVPSGAELQGFQAVVRSVAERVLPATVALELGGRGGTQGSGVIVSEDGLVLTAAHVIGDAGRRCLITFADGHEVRGRTLGSDPKIDAGMVQILERGPWPHAQLSARTLERGEWCIATGHPGGYESGRPPVLRLGRVLRESSRWGFIRTDCQIIRGDSGGPLFDLDGRLVGIHSRLEPRFSANYHVPVDMFRQRWDVLIASRGDVEMASLDVESLGIEGESSPEGLRVTRLREGLAAQRAGLLAGDVIVRFEGAPIQALEDLRNLLRSHTAGERVELDVLRKGEQLTVETWLQRKE